MSRDRKAPMGELLRFGIVAVAGLAVDLALAWVLAVRGGVPLTAAAAAGFAVGAVVNYILHELWTFRDGARQVSMRRVACYLAALGLVLAVRLAAVAVLSRLWPGDGSALTVLFAATGLSFVVNYVASKVLVFRKTEKRPHGEETT